ncbi:MAG: MFS family permease [Gammaproteobacteria bacterium]
MFSTLSTVFSLLLSYGLLLVANGLFSTLLGVRTQVEGFSPDIVGFIVASYFLGLLFGGVFAGRVVARVGHIRSFAAFASLMSVTALLHPLWITAGSWMMLRMLSGFCMAGLIMVTESWLNERASNENRGQVLSFYMTTNYFAAGSGQLLLSVGDPSQFQLFSIASAIFSLALLPVLLTRAKAPAPMQTARMPLRALYRLAPLGVIGVFCSGLMNSSIYGLGPVYATNIGLSKEQLSLFMASLIMSGLLLQWPMGRWSDRIGRGPLLVGIPVMVAIAAMAMAHVEEFSSILGFGILLGAFLFTIYSLSAAATNDMVGVDQRVQVAGGLLITYGAGASIGPIIGGQFMSFLGPPGLFFYFGIVSLFLALFALLKRRRDGSPETRKPFVVVPASQATSNQLYLSALNVSPDKVVLDSKTKPKL